MVPVLFLTQRRNKGIFLFLCSGKRKTTAFPFGACKSSSGSRVVMFSIGKEELTHTEGKEKEIETHALVPFLWLANIKSFERKEEGESQKKVLENQE